MLQNCTYNTDFLDKIETATVSQENIKHIGKINIILLLLLQQKDPAIIIAEISKMICEL